MSFSVKPSAYSQTFPVPAFVADRLLKLATHTQLKVLLYIMKNPSSNINAEEVGAACAIPSEEARDALCFWSQNGVLEASGEENAERTGSLEAVKAVAAADSRPSRQDVARRGLEDPALKMLLNEAQLKFKRNLKTNEAQTIVWMYDDLGFEASLVLLLLQYAVSEKRCNIAFMEKIAVSWSETGIDNISAAERWIAEKARADIAFRRVCRAFGIEQRRPSNRESELSVLWLSEWELDDSLLTLAYDACVDAKSKFSFPYTAKIIEKWHKSGFKTAEDVKKGKSEAPLKKQETTRKYDYAAYDIGAFEKMLDEDE